MVARASRLEPIVAAFETRDVAVRRLTATALPPRRHRRLECLALRPGRRVSRQDRELPVTATGKNWHDLVDQRGDVGAARRRREPPRELDRLDIRKARRM